MPLLGRPSSGPVRRVDDIGREPHLLGDARGLEQGIDADAVADEAGHVVGDHDAFAQSPVAEGAHGLQRLRGGVGGGDEFEEIEIPRRVVEMRAQEATAERLAAPPALHGHGDAAGVRAEERVGPGVRLDERPEVLLGLGLLDDGLDDPVAFGEAREVVGGVAEGQQRAGFRRVHEGRRPGTQGAFEPGPDDRVAAGGAAVAGGRLVEQEGGDAGVGEVGGDGRAHRARADDGGAADGGRRGGERGGRHGGMEMCRRPTRKTSRGMPRARSFPAITTPWPEHGGGEPGRNQHAVAVSGRGRLRPRWISPIRIAS